jgi:hypothetical protein
MVSGGNSLRMVFKGGFLGDFFFQKEVMVNKGNSLIMVFKGGLFLDFFFHVRSSTSLHLPPLRFHFVSEDAGIEPRTVATTALAVRRPNHSARDLIH